MTGARGQTALNGGIPLFFLIFFISFILLDLYYQFRSISPGIAKSEG